MWRIVLAIGFWLVWVSIAQAGPGSWRAQAATSTLTGAAGFTAQLDSDEALMNEVNEPEHAVLVVRCKESQLAFYVVWPQVIMERDSDVDLDENEHTTAWTRVDDLEAKPNAWDLSTNGTAAGKFDTKSAAIALGSLVGRHVMVVRMVGLIEQDATFHVDGVDDVAAQAFAACGLAPPKSLASAFMSRGPSGAPATAASHPWGPVGYGVPANIASNRPRDASLAAVRTYLASTGFAVRDFDAAAGHIVSSFQDAPPIDGFANCTDASGQVVAKGAQVQFMEELTVSDSGAVGRFGVRGYMPGRGPLLCAPSAPFPAALYQAMLNPPAAEDGKPRLGVVAGPPTAQMRTALGLPSGPGLLVLLVSPGSAADKAGVRVGDILVSLDGKPLAAAPDLPAAVAGESVGKTVKIEGVRASRPITFAVTF